jgi:hypothetical protein
LWVIATGTGTDAKNDSVSQLIATTTVGIPSPTSVQLKKYETLKTLRTLKPET